MRTFGAFLMIAGANLVVGSLGIVYYFAHTACSLSPEGCTSGPTVLFFDLLISRDGIALWVIMLIGALIFWRGKRMRAKDPE